jgi:hypothetical protein
MERRSFLGCFAAFLTAPFSRLREPILRIEPTEPLLIDKPLVMVGGPKHGTVVDGPHFAWKLRNDGYRLIQYTTRKRKTYSLLCWTEDGVSPMILMCQVDDWLGHAAIWSEGSSEPRRLIEFVER